MYKKKSDRAALPQREGKSFWKFEVKYRKLKKCHCVCWFKVEEAKWLQHAELTL